MNLEYQIITAFGLDLLVGDPRWFPHPVKAIGRLAQWLEKPARTIFRSEYIAGLTCAMIALIVVTAVSIGVLVLSGLLHPLARDAVSVFIIYSTISTRDLAVHSKAVYSALVRGDLNHARSNAALMVGRDTERLNEAEIVRATVESVAENTVDGITAPLFYAAIFGPAGAIFYRAVNTLDSTFGYRNRRYIKFGRFCAKIDDAANFLPARLTGLLISIICGVLGLRMLNAFKILFRDCRNHASPNAGFSEAAVAGALGVQLGGLNYYFGQAGQKPTIGEPLEPLARGHIKRANMLMLVTSLLFVVLSVILRGLIGGVFWRVAG